MNRRQFAASAAVVVAFTATGAALAASPPAGWDGLTRVTSKRLNYVYVLPGADFRAFSKVMLDPTQVAFRENWKRDVNASTRAPSGRVTDTDIERAVVEGGKAATDVFARAFAESGYPVVTGPGADVLRVSTTIENLSVTAPNTMTAGRSRTYSREAGSATLIVEVRDSVTGALLGRAVDNRIAGQNSYVVQRNSVTNRSDFLNVVRSWAKTAVSGLNELKSRSPVGGAG
jgi:hypothetical protein